MKNKEKKLRYFLLVILVATFFVACGAEEEVTSEVIDHPWSTTIMGEFIPGAYTGMLKDDIPNGTGIFAFSSDVFDVTYSGTWVDGQVSGKGNMRYNGLIIDVGNKKFTGNYSGDAIDGKPDGNGYFICTDAGKMFEYSGEWSNGAPLGNGMLDTDQCTLALFGKEYVGRYSGEVLNLHPNGDGKFILADLLTYEGQWTEGELTGAGHLFFASYEVVFSDGTVRIGTYDGDVLDGVASGYGAFTTKNDEGVVYTHTGEWSDGLPNGQGNRRWVSDSAYVYQGNFVNGEFTPTPLEYFITVGSFNEQEYTLSEKSKEFLANHPEIFVNNSVGDVEVGVVEKFNYNHYAKDSSQYGDELIVIKSLRVVQIFERMQFGELHTMCILQDGSHNVYYVNLYGGAEGIYENNYVTLTALPLDYFTYPNTAGTAVWAIACAGVSIVK